MRRRTPPHATTRTFRGKPGCRAKAALPAADTAFVTLPRTSMYPRIAIRLAAPLALTFLLPLAVARSWPSPAVWAILTTLVLSWLVFAYWTVQSQVQRSPEHARVLKEQDQLLN